MPEESKSSQLSPTEAAKSKAQGGVPRGGYGAPPVVRSGPTQQVQPPAQPQAGPPQGVPLHEFTSAMRADQQQRQNRSPEEIRSDMQRLAEGIKSHKAVLEGDKAEEEKKEKEEDNGDDSELFGSAINTDDLFNNRSYKKRIESRLEKMDIESLIMHGEVLQFVPILMKKGSQVPRLSATFRSVSALEDLAIKKKFYDEEGPDRFMIDRYSLMNLCIGLKALNGVEQPPHIDENGKFDDKLFEKKFTRLLKMPHQLLALLVVNYIWFDERVRRLLVADELGNG